MKMYRAVPKQGFNVNNLYEAQPTRRTPSNVPYLVDNIWEWLRPLNAPSRRHAAYASPTPELALANASSVGSDPSQYVVCEIVSNCRDALLAHLSVTDARLHADIGRIMRHVAAAHGKDFSNLPIAEKVAYAPLYLPAVMKQEFSEYLGSTEASKKLEIELRELSTFWKDASLTPQDHNGELFFELPRGEYYQLRPV